MEKIAVVISSGSGKLNSEQKFKLLREAFIEIKPGADFYLAHDGEAITSAVKKCALMKYKIICAAGGDGTVNVVARELVGTNTILGILPLGTLNHLAKDLHIPNNLKEAVNLLVHGKIKNIDVAYVNDKLFVNNSSIGLYPKLVKQRKTQEKTGKGRFLAFILGIISVWRNYTLFKVRVKFNNKNLVMKTPFVFVGNNEYKLEGLRFGSRQNLDAGTLCIYVASRPRLADLFILMAHAIKGTLRDHPDFETYKTNELVIASKKKFLSVSLDGEIETLTAPLHFKISPGALQVIVKK